jgi:competence transcription factor ComK
MRCCSGTRFDRCSATSIVTAAILLTLALLSFSNLSTRKSLYKFENAIERLGIAEIEILDMKVGFPREIAQRARAAKKFILDTNLNRFFGSSRGAAHI